MSVSVECIQGDRIFVIEDFLSKTKLNEDHEIDMEQSKELTIGDFVYYQDWSLESIGTNTFTVIKFIDSCGEELEAVESYFVTEEVWNNLKEYFKVNIK